MTHSQFKNITSSKLINISPKIIDKQVRTAYEYNKTQLKFLATLAEPLRRYYSCDLAAYLGLTCERYYLHSP